MGILLCAIFFLSGASALLFETLWFRQIGLVLGNSVWSSAVVTASFMAGLAFGNGLAAHSGSRFRRPVRVYALLELFVGLSGLLIVLGLPYLPPQLAPLLGNLVDRLALLNLVRLASSLALLLLPSTAMGLTLPLLVRALSERGHCYGEVLGRLYGWNTLGADDGPHGGEMWLVKRAGVMGSGIVAAGLNLLAGAGALWCSFARERRDPAKVDVAPLPTARASGRLLASAFVCGATLLALEVVWFRLLLLFVVATNVTFAILLAVVLTGIAGGSLIASSWIRRRLRATATLPFWAFGAGVATVVTYGRLGSAMSASNPLLQDDFAIAWHAAGLMLPICALSGGLFTLLGAALKTEIGEPTRSTGALTLANTIGATLGSLIAGFVLLPRLGVEKSVFLLALTYGVVAALTASLVTTGASRWPRRLLWLAAGGYAIVLALFPFGLMRARFLKNAAAWWVSSEGSRVFAWRESVTETILYLRKDLWDEPVQYRLVTNSVSMSASDSRNQRYMRLFAYWPLVLHRGPRRALLISYGLGETASALCESRDLESIDVVDTSRDILEMGRLVFPPPARFPLDDPRVHVHVEDGRFFLLATDTHYDIITGEPPPPKCAGIVSLYTREYFRLMRERLAEGGIATYWLPVGQLEVDDTKAIVRAFCDVFTDCSLWTGCFLDWMLVGSRAADGPLSESEFASAWKDPGLGPSLRAIGVETPEQLGALFLGDANGLREWTRDALPLQDNFPYRLSRRIPKRVDPFYLHAMDPRHTRIAFARSALVGRLWPEALARKSAEAFDAQLAVNQSARSDLKVPLDGLPELTWTLIKTRLRIPVLWLLWSSPREQSIAAHAAARGIREPLLDEFLAIEAMVARDYPLAAKRFTTASLAAPADQRIARLRALALFLAGESANARRVVAERSELASEPKQRAAWDWLAAYVDACSGLKDASTRSIVPPPWTTPASPQGVSDFSSARWPCPSDNVTLH